ncbi:hypothetical protein [Sulfobacillus thermosulfidooxidans]|uniref:hypothetical protein n=1 Tax=Sulfobacillus thermosulfidooxidans TaxID=28034 RepID=UPI0006B5BF59|nr:hypothetical protein [Sulfobacillus thermosulfidooxidans]
MTPAWKAQGIQEALDIPKAAAVARRHGLPIRLVHKGVQTATQRGTPEEARALKCQGQFKFLKNDNSNRPKTAG